MDSSKLSSLFLICILFISTASPILACPYCGVPKPPSTPKPPGTGVPVLPVPLPPVTVPPVTPVVPVPLPPVTVPPVTPVLPVPLPPVTVPPVTPVLPVPLPPVVPVIPLPPVVPVIPLPPVVPVLPVPLPPVPILNPPATPTPSGKPCPPAQPKCPINVLKLSACVDILGGLVHSVIGHPVKAKCCPVLKGLVDAEAAACLCTTIKVKALNIKIYAPIALQVLLTCGKHPPPGFTCPL